MRSAIFVAADRRLVELGGLYRFVQIAWPRVEPSVRMIDGWHIRVMCERLDDVLSGKIDRLIINIPPGCSKSLIVSVFFPAYAWTVRPELRWMFASHDLTLAHRDANKTRELVTSSWYIDRWGEIIDNRSTRSDAVGLYWTCAGGMRMSSTIGGKGVGWHAHGQVVDDHIKPTEAAFVTSAALMGSKRWWGNTMASRKADAAFFFRIIIMQRVHKLDLSGVCLDAGGWYHLCLPMEYRHDHPYRCDDDPRTEDGELLCPERFSRRDVDEMRREMGPAVAAAQLDQLPSPIGGGVLKRSWLTKFWTRLPAGGVWYQSWDHTFGSLKKSASYVVGQVWVKVGGDSYKVDQVRARMEFPEMLSSIRTLSAKYPQALTKLVEAKASGPMIEQMMRREVGGIVLVKADVSTGGKLARVHGVSGLYEAGNVWHPHPSDAWLNGEPHPCAWVHDMIERYTSFTGADSDVADEVDAASQCLAYMHGSGASRFVRAMQAAAKERIASEQKI